MLFEVVLLMTGMLATLVGVIYRRMSNQISDVEETADKNEQRLSKLLRGLYGREDSPDDGYVGEISNLSEEVKKLSEELSESRQERREEHAQVSQKLDRIQRRLDEVEEED